MVKEGFLEEVAWGRALKEPSEAGGGVFRGRKSGHFKVQGLLLRFTSSLASWDSSLSVCVFNQYMH